MATPNDLRGLYKMNPVAAYEKGKADGKKETKGEYRQELLTWLEEKYMNPEVERDSPMASAILTLARDLAKHLREH